MISVLDSSQKADLGVFMPTHTVGLDQVQKITGYKRQRRAAKMRILRDELCRRGTTIGKLHRRPRDRIFAQAPRMVNSSTRSPRCPATAAAIIPAAPAPITATS